MQKLLLVGDTDEYKAIPLEEQLISGELEKKSYRVIASTTDMEHPDWIHMFAIDPLGKFVDVEYHPETMDFERERMVEGRRELTLSTLDSVANIIMPYPLFSSIGLFAAGDYKGVLGGLAVAVVYSIFNVKRNFRRIKENTRDMMAHRQYEEYVRWIENLEKAAYNSQDS